TAPLVRVGEPVMVGTPLGWLGRTGSAAPTRPHVHYEWRDWRGAVKNPYRALLVAHGKEPSAREVREVVSCAGGALRCDLLVGDAQTRCRQASETLLASKSLELDKLPELPEWPPSTLGDRPVRWDIIAGVGGVIMALFFATTRGWFVRRRRR
ncbi:MAG: hypothetical protein ACREKH_07385, partial [Candidatus Rokuibacteriota bacterium]